MSSADGIIGMPDSCHPGDLITLTSEVHSSAFSHGDGATIRFELNTEVGISFSAFIPSPPAPKPILRFLAPSGIAGGCSVFLNYNDGTANIKLELGSIILRT
jgi:hypothetical protein